MVHIDGKYEDHNYPLNNVSKEQAMKDFWEEGGGRPQNDNVRINNLFWRALIALIILVLLALIVRPALADDLYYQQLMQQEDNAGQAANDRAMSNYEEQQREQSMQEEMQHNLDMQQRQIDEMRATQEPGYN